MSRTHKGNKDSLYYYKWLDKALCDLQSARILFTWGGDFSNVAFHCQQAIEKALKGFLLFKSGQHFDGHNLTYLCRQAILLDKSFEKWVVQSAMLNNLYIETRYPVDIPLDLDEVVVKNYLNMAEDMFSDIRRELYKSGRPHKIKK